jgi:tetratricopeptide (TPR) repeat protein
MEFNFLYILAVAAIAVILYLAIMNIVKDKSNFLEKANRQMEAGDFDGAMETYNQLILKNAFNPQYHALLAFAFYRTENYQRAVVEYEIALKNQKELSLKELNSVNKYCGICYFHLKNYPKAFLALYNSFITSPQDAEICYNLGMIYASQRKFEKALDYMSRAVGQEPMNYDAHYYTGLVATEANRRDIAIREFSVAKKINSQAVLDLYIGCLYKENKDFMNAIKSLKGAVRGNLSFEDKTKALILMGECYKGLGLIEDAVTALELARQETDSASDPKAFEMKKNVLYNLGMAYMKEGKPEKSASTWNDLKQYDFFYKDVKELTSGQLSEDIMAKVTERWMLMPGLTVRDIIPTRDIVSKKFFDIDTLEKTVTRNMGDIKEGQPVSSSKIELFKQLNIKKFRETCRDILKYMGFTIQKEITLKYDSDFADGKAAAFVTRKNNGDFLVILKRHNDDVSGFVLLNALGTAKTMNISHVVVIITSRYKDDALLIAQKNANLTIIDRRGLIKALNYALQ